MVIFIQWERTMSNSPEIPSIYNDLRPSPATSADPASTDPDAMPERLGKYRLLRKLGEGGVGVVYLAEDTVLHREIALKVLTEKNTRDQRFLVRLKREVRAAAALTHPNLMQIYEVSQDGARHFFTLEYCEGDPLDVLLARCERFTVKDALDVIVQMAWGLQYAHDHGFVHRDVKPANIFVCKTGIAKLLDFGTWRDHTDADPMITPTPGTTRESSHYISPEYARADPSLDGRTDIYSLGATFFHLVTGQTPFQGPTPATVVLKHLYEDPPDVSTLQRDVPDGVSQVIRKMMAKDPLQRYPGCAELLCDLERLRNGKPPLLALSSPPTSNADAAAAGTGDAGKPKPAKTASGRWLSAAGDLFVRVMGREKE
jgi:serine/threonine protein kinase